MSDSNSPVHPIDRDAEALLDLRRDPPRLGRLAIARRAALFEREALLRPTPAHERPRGPALLRGDRLLTLDVWPTPAAWEPGDRLMLPIEPDDEAAIRRYASWLIELGEHRSRRPLAPAPERGPCSLAPFCAAPGGTHRLWLIAAARLALPAAIRVEARHDLIGIRLAQVALGFGADTLAGPVDAERHLPVAGVTRPTEASLTGLRNLIEQAGLVCRQLQDQP